MKRFKLPLSLLVFAALAVSAVGAPNIIQRSLVQHLKIQADGSAVVEQTETIPVSPLKAIYDAHTRRLKETDDARENFLREFQKSYLLEFGAEARLEIASQESGHNDFTRMLRGRGAGFALSSNKDPAVREIFLRQQEGDQKFTPFLEYVLDELFFESLFLANPKVGTAELVTNTLVVIELPEGADIINMKELAGREWHVDFGGGTRIVSKLQVEGRVVRLQRTATLVNAPPKRLLERDESRRLLKDLYLFESCIIRYREKGRTNPLPSRVASAFAAADFSGNWNESWTANKSYAFQWQIVNVNAAATASFALKASLLWEHAWSWKDGYHLEHFQAVASASPTVGLKLEAQATSTFEKKERVNLLSLPTQHVVFWVALVPVDLAFQGSIDAEALAKVTGQIDLTTGTSLVATGSLTCDFKNNKWTFLPNGGLTPTSPVQSTNATATVDGNLRGDIPLTLGVYLYDVAGPYVELSPYLDFNVYAKAEGAAKSGGAALTYTLDGGVDLSGGVKMAGWLESLLGSGRDVPFGKKNVVSVHILP